MIESKNMIIGPMLKFETLIDVVKGKQATLCPVHGEVAFILEIGCEKAEKEWDELSDEYNMEDHEEDLDDRDQYILSNMGEMPKDVEELTFTLKVEGSPDLFLKFPDYSTFHSFVKQNGLWKHFDLKKVERPMIDYFRHVPNLSDRLIQLLPVSCYIEMHTCGTPRIVFVFHVAGDYEGSPLFRLPLSSFDSERVPPSLRFLRDDLSTLKEILKNEWLRTFRESQMAYVQKMIEDIDKLLDNKRWQLDAAYP